MDASSFNDPAVAEAAGDFAMLRADVTLLDTETEEVMRGYNVLGVPTYLFFTANGEEAERLVGFVFAVTSRLTQPKGRTGADSLRASPRR